MHVAANSYSALKWVSITQRIVPQLECKHAWDKKYSGLYNLYI